MSGLTVVKSRAVLYHAANQNELLCARRFGLFIHMSSSDITPPTRAKLQKIVQQEFASTIRGEIKTATDDLKSTNKSELERVGRDLVSKFRLMVVAATIIVSLVITVVGFYVYVHVPEAVKNQVHDQIDPIRGELVPIRERLTKLETTTDFLEKLKKITSYSDPTSLKNNLTLLVGTLQDARSKGVIIDPRDVAGIGNSLINVSYQYPDTASEAWKALGEVMEYRSYLNSKLYADATHATIRATNRRAEAFKYTYTPTSIDYRFKGLILENVTQQLDWLGWENVIFRNCVIRYSGNPITLKNVAFENCQFEFLQDPQAAEISKAVLASNIVNHSESRAAVDDFSNLSVVPAMSKRD